MKNLTPTEHLEQVTLIDWYRYLKDIVNDKDTN